MIRKLSESAIVKAVAEQALRRITRKVIANLQSIGHTLSGEDSGLTNAWDEICAQVQYEESYAWEVYDATVRAVVCSYVSELPAHEREAIWLQTETGLDWDCEEVESREAYPVFDDDIVEYIKREHVYPEADRWSNARIRAYLERSRMRD